MPTQRFTATARRSGSAVVLDLPFDPQVVWGVRARHDVTGTLAGHPYRGKVITSDGRPALSLGPAWRRESGVEVGDAVEAELSLEEPQIESLDADIADAVRADDAALAAFEGMPTFHKKNYVRWIEEAQRPETRARRIAEAVRMMAAGKRA